MITALAIFGALIALCVANRLSDKTYVFKVMLYLDMLGCSLIWRDADLTISSMTGLALRKLAVPRWAAVLGWVLNKLQPGHCELAIADDIARAKAALAQLGAAQ
jgi:hypothetical protein